MHLPGGEDTPRPRGKGRNRVQEFTQGVGVELGMVHPCSHMYEVVVPTSPAGCACSSRLVFRLCCHTNDSSPSRLGVDLSYITHFFAFGAFSLVSCYFQYSHRSDFHGWRRNKPRRFGG